MCGECSTHGRDEKGIQNISWGNKKEDSHLKDLGRDGRIIFKWVEKQGVD
jgi:hypothetical protein